MGISAAGMYAQLTTGAPLRVTSRVARRPTAHQMQVSIDIARNRPRIRGRRRVPWERPHGTRVELELEGHYEHGQHSIALYLKLVAVVNPHVTLELVEPDGTLLRWPRRLRRRPPVPHRIKPHPAGIELGVLMSMLHASEHRRLGAFLREELAQVGDVRARAIIAEAGHRLTPRSNTRRISRAQVQALHHVLREAPVPAPPTDCVVPIGEAGLLRGLAQEVPGRFMVAVTRRPAVYRGYPFVVEVAISHGREDAPHVEVGEDGHLRRAGRASSATGARDPIRLLRFANRVPLLYQQSHCAITQAASRVHWNRYGLEQPAHGLPLGPMTLIGHVASVWVPFTSESKEAIASYPEIARELELAMQQCGRKLAAHLRKDQRLEQELARRSEVGRYLPYVAEALQTLLGLDDDRRERLVRELDALLRESRRIR
jgi:DNA topoisomerase-6 subunit B